DALSRDLASMASGLRERESRLRAIFDAAPVPMLVIDARRRSVIDINAAWKVQFGTARSAAIGRPADEVVRLSGGGRWGNAPWSPGWPGGGAEIHVVGPDGKPMHCEVRARQAVIDTGTAIVASFKDVTDTRRMETELRDLNARLEVRVAERTREIEAANRELSQVVQTLRVAQDELVRAEKLASLGRVVAGVAHELNTPIGNALLAATGFQERTREFAAAVEGGLRRKTLGEFIEGATAAGDLVVRGLQRAATLVATFKRVAIDQTSEQRRDFSLKATVEEISATAAPGVKRSSHRLEVHVADDVAMDSYPGALGQVLLNLIGNAVAHAFDGREGGTVRVLARQAGGDLVELTVADDGNGIDPAVVDRIFDPFFTTKRGRGGTGLGLHIVHNAVTRVLGGRIAVRSAPGAGADFVVTMPRVAPAESVPADRPYV
ncbi:MAG: PAS domain-containing protein, partial [Alphaproteobacteria bacterium]|nr:PAS domain-containing protein [Alphaproteobacteria bacterium]